METWIVGDIHGAIFTLEKLLKKLPKNARIVFLGDLVDRGNFAKDVFELVTSRYETLMGNHEFLMYNYIRDALLRGKNSMWNENEAYGGEKTVRSYKEDIDTLMRHIELIPKLPKYLEIEGYFLTHGFGLPYYRQKKNKSRQLFVNRLEEPYADWEDWSEYKIINIFGHTVYKEPLFGKNFIGIDTGCGHGMRLSAISLHSHKTVSVETDERDFA